MTTTLEQSVIFSLFKVSQLRRLRVSYNLLARLPVSAVTLSLICLPLYRANQKRFQRIESHIITLARSVAHISFEMRSHSSLFVEVDRLAKEVDNIKQVIVTESEEF